VNDFGPCLIPGMLTQKKAPGNTRGKHLGGSDPQALNIRLGWSLLGWVAAFVWSLPNTETYGGVGGYPRAITCTSMPTATIPTTRSRQRVKQGGHAIADRARFQPWGHLKLRTPYYHPDCRR